MKNRKTTYIKNILLPCFLLSGVTGIVTGALIFLFKEAASYIIGLSEAAYSHVRENPAYLPLLILGAAVIGLAAAAVLRFAKDCRGGGIPTAIASIRGLIPLRRIEGIFALFASSMLTFLCGVPLGNEGPSVQMGTAAGKGTTDLLGKNMRAFERYTMTGGACAGFAAATGAPLTGILFALEEAHRRFSPMIFMVASVSTVTGTVTHNLLLKLFGRPSALFDFGVSAALPYKLYWIPVIIGIVCGALAIAFTKFYKLVRKFSAKIATRVPFFAKITAIFAAVAALGFLSADFVGTGHSFIEKIAAGEAVWYIMLAAVLVRGALMIASNAEGVSGGLFVPTLTFGAIIGSLAASGIAALGLVGGDEYVILVAVGMASFLSAASRTPITALSFSAEVLCGVDNLLPVGIAVAVSYIIIETAGVPSLADTVIEAKTEAAHEGKSATVVDAYMKVARGASAVGKEIRDILWPPTCVVLSVEKATAEGTSGIGAGDLLHLHYRTYDPDDTLRSLEYILGEQDGEIRTRARAAEESHITPND